MGVIAIKLRHFCGDLLHVIDIYVKISIRFVFKNLREKMGLERCRVCVSVAPLSVYKG